MEQMRRAPDVGDMRGEIDAGQRGNEQRLQDELNRTKSKLTKLWDAYEAQEKDVVRLKTQISTLEQELLQKDTINANLKQALEARDSRLRESDVELHGAKRSLESAEPKIKSLESQVRASEERYARVLRMWQATHEASRFWKKSYEALNEWFDRHIGLVGDLTRAMGERDDLIKNVRRESAGLEIEQKMREQAAKAGDGPPKP